MSIQWDQTGRREEESHQPWSEHHHVPGQGWGFREAEQRQQDMRHDIEGRDLEGPSLPAVIALGAQLWGSRTRGTAGPLLPPGGHQGKGGELSLRLWTNLGPWVSSVKPVSPHLSPLEEQTRAPGLASSYSKFPSGLRILALGFRHPSPQPVWQLGWPCPLQEVPAQDRA